MARLTVEIPDGLLSQVESAGYSIDAILLKALAQYLANGLPIKDVRQTRTWQLCGRFAVSEPISTGSLSEDQTEITNYAEQIDDGLYQGF